MTGKSTFISGKTAIIGFLMLALISVTVRADAGTPHPDAARWFAFEPRPDAFDERSIIDMSHLMHSPAGRYGPLQADGASLVFRDRPEEAVKLWGVNCGPGAAAGVSKERHARQARFLKKYGVNIVRLHPMSAPPRRFGGYRSLLDSPEALDAFDHWFAALKEHGVYMKWSPFAPSHVVFAEDGFEGPLYDELPDTEGGKRTYGMVAFVEAWQDAQWRFIGELLEHENPYTGLRYADAPALAIIELVNEDSVFWHHPLNAFWRGNFPEHAALLRGQWSAWVRERYESDDALREAWGDEFVETLEQRPGGDRQAGGVDGVEENDMAIYAGWELDAGEPGRRRGRRGDFVRFLAETQRAFYERQAGRIRDTGYEGLVIGSNWRSGGPAGDAANLWTDGALDMIDRHSYFGGGAGGHNIRTGRVNNQTHLDRPGRGIIAMGLYQVEDKPFGISEWTQLPPNQWKAEITPLYAFYGMGLQGWDASFHFAHSTRGGALDSMGRGWPGLRSYISQTPHYMGQFPALARAIHGGHVAEGPIIAARRFSPDEIFQGYDVLRHGFSFQGDIAEAAPYATPTELLAVGRVTVKIDEDLEEEGLISDVSEYWDRDAGVVRSATGELTWDYGSRVVVLSAEKSQAVVGFAGGMEFDLPGVAVTISPETPFVSLLFTALDDMPLIESGHILITALARDKQTGTVYSDDGTELLEIGAPPLLLEPVQAELRVKGGDIESVRVVDIYGVPTDEAVPHEDNTFHIDGRYSAFYYEVLRD